MVTASHGEGEPAARPEEEKPDEDHESEAEDNKSDEDGAGDAAAGEKAGRGRRRVPGTHASSGACKR